MEGEFEGDYELGVTHARLSLDMYIQRTVGPCPWINVGLVLIHRGGCGWVSLARQNALRQQDERTIASTAKAHGDIWGGDKKAGKKSEPTALPKEPSNALTQRGFTLLVKLIEELQYEKDLQRDQGVSLVGPVRVV